MAVFPEQAHEFRAAVSAMSDNSDFGLHLDGFLCAVMNKYTTRSLSVATAGP
jgi:hypothetical protein